jgi:hypothetical protein
MASESRPHGTLELERSARYWLEVRGLFTPLVCRFSRGFISLFFRFFYI